MKIAITGANGMIGQYLSQYLAHQNHSVIGITRRVFTAPFIENRLLADYQNENTAMDLLEDCDSVIHLAGLAHNPNANAKDYHQVNVVHTLTIGRAALVDNVKSFIYISSIKVNGERTTQQPFSPYDKPQPEDAYGRSKLEAEQALTKLFKNTTTRLIIIRPPLVWGGPPTGNLALLEKAIRYHIPLPLAAINNRRDMVRLENLASLICLCINSPKLNNSLLFVSDGDPKSTTTIVQQIARSINHNVLLFKMPSFIINILQNTSRLSKIYDRLFGNLEVDITNTKALTQWSPSSQLSQTNHIHE